MSRNLESRRKFLIEAGLTIFTAAATLTGVGFAWKEKFPLSEKQVSKDALAAVEPVLIHPKMGITRDFSGSIKGYTNTNNGNAPISLRIILHPSPNNQPQYGMISAYIYDPLTQRVNTIYVYRHEPNPRYPKDANPVTLNKFNLGNISRTTFIDNPDRASVDPKDLELRYIEQTMIPLISHSKFDLRATEQHLQAALRNGEQEIDQAQRQSTMDQFKKLFASFSSELA